MSNKKEVCFSMNEEIPKKAAAKTPKTTKPAFTPPVIPASPLEKGLFPGVDEMNTGLAGSKVMLYYGDLEAISDLTQRKLFYYGDDLGMIDTNVQYNIVKSIFGYNFADREAGIPKEKRKPIFLYLLSPGGEVSAGFSIIDAIELSETPVYVINVGECSSMAFLIFLSGHKRFAFPNATFLMHDGSTWTYGSTAKVISQAKNLELIEERIKVYVIKHTKIDEKLYDKNYLKEWMMFPEEAKKHGVCDYILGEDMPFNMVY